MIMSYVSFSVSPLCELSLTSFPGTLVINVHMNTCNTCSLHTQVHFSAEAGHPRWEISAHEVGEILYEGNCDIENVRFVEQDIY